MPLTVLWNGNFHTTAEPEEFYFLRGSFLLLSIFSLWMLGNGARLQWINVSNRICIEKLKNSWGNFWAERHRTKRYQIFQFFVFVEHFLDFFIPRIFLFAFIIYLMILKAISFVCLYPRKWSITTTKTHVDPFLVCVFDSRLFIVGRSNQLLLSYAIKSVIKQERFIWKRLKKHEN